MLTRGISVNFIMRDKNISKLQLSTGTSIIGDEYEEKCFISKSDWREPSMWEFDLLCSDNIKISDICLLRLPDNHVRAFQRQVFDAITCPDYKDALKAPIEAFARSATSWLNSLGLPFFWVYLGSDLAFAPPNLNSTAFDRVKRIYKGLHIDDHERLSYQDRDASFVLFNINIGNSIRYFQFINHDVQEIINNLSDNLDCDVRSWPTYRIKDHFFSLYENYPVIRAILSPGEAYLCQTQNLIHDGSTNCYGCPDISLLIALRAKVNHTT